MSVVGFLKRNFVVVLGVALPSALVLFLVIVRGMSISSVPDPRYDLLFTTGNHGDSPLEFSVEGGRLKVRYLPPAEGRTRPATASRPELYYLDVERLAARKIPIELPVDEKGELVDRVQVLDVPMVAGLELDPSSMAPDGYQFEYSRSNGGLLTDIWGGRGRYGYVLHKDGRRIKVPDTSYRYGVRLVGWVVAGELAD